MTIHNIGYQGIMPGSAVPDLGLGSASAQLDQDDLSRGIINALKTGIRFAHRVTRSVPPMRAKFAGRRLEWACKARCARAAMGGRDFERRRLPRMGPTARPLFDRRISGRHDLRGKSTNKEALIAALKLTIQSHRR